MAGMRTIIITAVPAVKGGIGTIAVRRANVVAPVMKKEGSASPPPVHTANTARSVQQPLSLPVKRELTVDEDSPPTAHSLPRKRQRLTHLTPEEKLSRRKLKNRIAAQTARDRKKAKMSDLEVTLEQLRKENRSLHSENRGLKERSSQLTVENQRLMKELQQLKALKEMMTGAAEAVQPIARPGGAVEPAAFINASLPQKQASPVWVLSWILASALSSLWTSSSSSSSTRPVTSTLTGSASTPARTETAQAWRQVLATSPDMASTCLAIWKATRKKAAET